LVLEADHAFGVQDGGVVAAAKVSTDLLKTQCGELAGQVHADLTWKGH